jgi:hypothetical protein
MAGQTLEGHAICPTLKELHGPRYLCSLDDLEVPTQDHWRQALSSFAGGLPFPQDSAKTHSMVNLLINNIVTAVRTLGPHTVLVGIEKKGMGLLIEMVEIMPQLKDLSLLSDTELTLEKVGGRHVILVDDTVNRGVTLITVTQGVRELSPLSLRALVLVGKASGLANARAASIEVSAVHEATDDEFSNQFLQWISPLLRDFRNGALPNRPHSVMKVPCNGDTLEGTAVAVIGGLLEATVAESIREIPACDGGDGPVFHATIVLTDEEKERIARGLPAGHELDGNVEVRVFFGPSDPLHVHLCGIVYLVSPSSGEAESVSCLTAKQTIDAIEESVINSFKQAGRPLPQTL